MTVAMVVDWPATYRRLVAAAVLGEVDQVSVDWRIRHRQPILSREHMELACMAMVLGEAGLIDAAAMAAGTARWLVQAAAVAFATVDARPKPLQLASVPDHVLHLDPRLTAGGPWLLAGLADDWARARQRALIVQQDADVRPGALGSSCASEAADVARDGRRVDVAVIRVARHAYTANAHETMNHEFSHLCDPSPVRTEAFADALAALLVDELPATLAEAQPLIERATAACPSVVSAGEDAQPQDIGEVIRARAQLLAEFAALPLSEVRP